MSHFRTDLGVRCHGMSRDVTGCHRISTDKGGVTVVDTLLYLLLNKEKRQLDDTKNPLE